jgi:large subunit ribosomal protein L5
MAALKQKYDQEVRKQLKEEFGYTNPMVIPRLVKVVVSMGLAEAGKDKGSFQQALTELSLITGQAPIVTQSRQAISNFKLRKGQPIGAKVTMRRKRMWDFTYRLIHIAAPRIRDFRGFSPKGDGRGNYSLGIEDQQIWAEVPLDQVKRQQGMNITFVTTAKTEEEGMALMRALGMPLRTSERG